MGGFSIGADVFPAQLAIEVPVFPAVFSLLGLVVLVAILLAAFKPQRRAARPATIAVQQPSPNPIPAHLAAPAPAPVPVTYKRAPVSLHFPAIRSDYPDVWGVKEPLEVVLRLEDKTLQSLRQVPGLTLQVDGATYTPVFSQGAAAVRHTFTTLGDKPIQVDIRVKNETLPRRAARPIKIVDYRTEIAEVFSNFREEASRVITPIRQDATPWEIFDLLTSANPNLPSEPLRHIIASFEEAKFSNHPVTRATYERLIHALLQLERVEL